MVAPSDTPAGYVAQLAVVTLTMLTLAVLAGTGTISGDAAIAGIFGLIVPVPVAGAVADRAVKMAGTPSSTPDELP